jgi:predicted nucleic acid-binding protein
VRVLSNKALAGDKIPPAEAMAILGKMTADPGHTFWADDMALTDVDCSPARFLVGYRQVTDYYLLGLAVHKGGRFVTLDRGALSLLPQNSRHRDSVILIETTGA